MLLIYFYYINYSFYLLFCFSQSFFTSYTAFKDYSVIFGPEMSLHNWYLITELNVYSFEYITLAEIRLIKLLSRDIVWSWH